MLRQLRSSPLILGSALITFALTLGTFALSVATVGAVDCFSDGQTGIGPTCQDEYESGQYSWESCAQCANVICTAFGFSSPPDMQCINTCIAGTYQAGCQ